MAGGEKKGMPAPVKAVLSKFGGGKEEDKMVGYLSFLKIGPKLLRFLPGKKVRDLRNWLTIYGYWNQVRGLRVLRGFGGSRVEVPRVRNSGMLKGFGNAGCCGA